MQEKAKKGELQEASKPAAKPVKRRRWDQVGEETPGATPKKKASTWEQAEVSIQATSD